MRVSHANELNIVGIFAFTSHQTAVFRPFN